MFSCITLALRGAEISLQLCGDVRGSMDRALRRSFIFKLHRRDCCSLRSAGDDRRHSHANRAASQKSADLQHRVRQLFRALSLAADMRAAVIAGIAIFLARLDLLSGAVGEFWNWC